MDITVWLRCVAVCLLMRVGYSKAPDECSTVLHVYDPLPGVGLGQVAASHAAVMETFSRRNIGVSIHDCALKKEYELRASCTERVSSSLLEMYTPASEFSCGVAPPPGLTLLDGQENWTNARANRGFLLINPHARYAFGDKCDSVRKWLRRPSKLGETLFRDVEAVAVAFHVRLFDGNDALVSVSDDLTVTVNEDRGDSRVAFITDRVVRDMVHHIVKFAGAEWEKKKTFTYVATDSPTVRRKLSNFTFIKTNPHAESKIPPEHRLYDTASLYDFHALSMASTIISMPTSSSFSQYAGCRGEARVLTAKTFKEIESLLQHAGVR